MVNTGKKLEDYAQYVYSRLLELNDYENTLVSTKVTIKGQSGATNEFDVYYQFTHLNIECRVAIECKDWAVNFIFNVDVFIRFTDFQPWSAC